MKDAVELSFGVAELQRILSECEAVELDGIAVKVGDPPLVEALEIQDAVRELVESKTMATPEGVRKLLDVSRQAIQLCVRVDDRDDLTEREAGALLVRGGMAVMSNPLALACLSRCGCGWVTPGKGDGLDEDPT